MADAYFRITGVPLPVYVSTGPDRLYLLRAVANAYYDSSAFLLITGQVTTDQFDSGALQEPQTLSADYPSVIRTYVKHSFQATTVNQISQFLPKAFKLMRRADQDRFIWKFHMTYIKQKGKQLFRIRRGLMPFHGEPVLNPQV